MNPEARLAEIRDGIVKSRKKELYRTIVVELIDNDGDLDIASTLFQQRWAEPSNEVLDSLVAAKVNAAIDHCAAQIALLSLADDASRDKVSKMAELMVNVQADADDTASLDSAMADLADFQAMAAHLAAPPAPSPGSRSASAGVADSSGKVK